MRSRPRPHAIPRFAPDRRAARGGHLVAPLAGRRRGAGGPSIFPAPMVDDHAGVRDVDRRHGSPGPQGAPFLAKARRPSPRVALAEQPNRVLSRDALMQRLPHRDSGPFDRAIDAPGAVTGAHGRGRPGAYRAEQVGAGRRRCPHRSGASVRRHPTARTGRTADASAPGRRAVTLAATAPVASATPATRCCSASGRRTTTSCRWTSMMPS